MRTLRVILCSSVFLLATVISSSAQPAFVNGIVIPGTTLDATGLPGANQGRFGAFSDIYYDPVRNEWWALSDRGPGGGLLDYETRLQRFEVSVNPITGRISNFRILQTVKLQDRNGRLTAPAASVPNPEALNGSNPQLLNGNPAVLGRSLDPEGLAVDPRSGHFLITDEYGPSLYEFSRTGRLIAEFEVPANLVPRPTAAGVDYVGVRNGDFSGLGRQDNRGYEGVAISPDGKKLFAVLQDPLINEGPRTSGTPENTDNDGRDGQWVRIVVFDNDWWSPTYRKSIAQYAYQLESQQAIAARILAAGGSAVAAPRVNLPGSANDVSPDPSQGRNIGLSAIVALNDHQFLVIERDNRGIGVDDPIGANVVGSKRVYKIDITGATDVSNEDLPDSGDLAASGIVPVTKDSEVFIDLTLNSQLPNGKQAEKWEGLTIGPRLLGGRHLILTGNDSDYSVTQTGAGTQFDIYVNFLGGSVQRDLDNPTLLNGVLVGPPPAGYSLLPSVLHAYRASARDLAGYEPPRGWLFGFFQFLFDQFD
ncbi:MAG: esterase-like activity of phytase family protein [Vicinamibacterales bacterium]|nr:esterase-like activity of phytase family protein [Vicinamibacterales bacterium]